MNRMSIKIGNKVKVVANNADYWKLKEEEKEKYGQWIGYTGVVIDEFTKDEFEVDFSEMGVDGIEVDEDGVEWYNSLWHISELEVVE